MRQITKGPEPRSLTAHRKARCSNYDNYKAKDELRRTLVTEQRGLCCYCMKRIRDDRRTKIEHWQSQSCYSDQQLVYRNLLAACPGGMGQRRADQHCDTRKENDYLSWNPADPSHHIETRIRYRLDGSIWSDEGAFNTELNDVLNLNLQVLKENRKGMLDSILEWWRIEKRRRKPVSRSRFQRERQRWQPDDGELAEYCQVVVWWLDQRLAKLRQ